MGGILLLSIGMVSGCAHTSLLNTNADDSGSDGAVRMVVVNRTPDLLRIWANWEDVGAGALRRGSRQLGQLLGEETGRYTIPYRWRGVSLSVEPVLRTPSPRLPQAPRPGPRDPLPHGQVVEIGPGDRLDWEIEATLGFYVIRLRAHDNPGASPPNPTR